MSLFILPIQIHGGIATHWIVSINSRAAIETVYAPKRAFGLVIGPDASYGRVY